MDDKAMFFCILLLIIGIIVYQYFTYTSELNQIKNSIQQKSVCPAQGSCPVQETVIRTIEQAPQKITVDVNQNDQSMPLSDPLRDYDYRTLTDPLVPPFKRDDYNIGVIPIATRGYPTGYKKIGLLIDSEADNSDKYKFLVLVGRQKYPGSTQYDYFATDNNQDSVLKFDLPHLHKELYTDDDVTINELNKTYKAKIDRSLGFEYNPFMY